MATRQARRGFKPLKKKGLNVKAYVRLKQKLSNLSTIEQQSETPFVIVLA